MSSKSWTVPNPVAALPFKRRDWGLLLVLPGIIMFSMFMLVPILYLLYTSFTDATNAGTLIGGSGELFGHWLIPDIFDGLLASLFGGSASFIGLDNYTEMIQDSQFWTSFGITWLFVAVSLVFKIILAVGIALILNHARVTGKRYMRASVIVPLGFPGIFLITVWSVLWSDASFGVFNTLLARFDGLVESLFGLFDALLFWMSVSAPSLLLTNPPIGWLSNRWTAFFAYVTTEVWLAYPFMVIIIVSALQDVPEELHDAAKVDGAGYLRRFTNVTLPSIRRPVLFASILTAATSFQQFLVPWVFNQGGPARQNELIIVYGYREAIAFQEFGLSATILITTIGFIGLFMWLAVRFGNLAEGVQADQ